MRWHYSLPQRAEKRVSEPNLWIFTSKELAWMLIAVLIGTFISFVPIIPNDKPFEILTRLIIFILIIFTSVTTKKLIAPHYSIKIEHRVWEFQRWGYYQRAHLKKPFPIGLVLPFFIGFFSLGIIKPYLFLQFDIDNLLERRILKARGNRRNERKDLINDEDYGYTAASGFYSLLALALTGLILNYYLNFKTGLDLAKFSVYFGLWNLIPFGQLDGNKLFFGITIGWFFITLLFLLFLGVFALI